MVVYIITGKDIVGVEGNATKDLKNDLAKVFTGDVHIISETDPLPRNGSIFLVGTPQTNQLMAQLLKEKNVELTVDNPGSRGGLWSKVTLANGNGGVVLAGSDIQGLQYAIYDYSQAVLGIDPLAYWTGNIPEKDSKVDIFNFEPKVIAPPKVPILCYFENDVDELANYRGIPLQYDWESYTEMINSLVRLRYNAIQLFDMLGRPEFFMRPEYKERYPEYRLDVDYLDKMIRYAQGKGMKIQVDFALGYQILPMDESKASCWKEYKEDWVNAWRYYLEKTPLSKTDIFILRPRNQVWDWEYKSTCGEDKMEVFNEVFAVFDEVLETYKSDAIKALICYSDAMDMYNEGFRPPKDWIIAWSDDGFGDFEYLPETTDGYQFGTYMHAGFWLNHTVHDPYPRKVESKMKQMFNEYGADAYCLVNGQTFRPFLLNIEAYSEVCRDPMGFNGEDFYTEWTERYFNKEAATHARRSMQFLNKAQQNGKIGYVQHLWEIREAISYLSNSPIERPGKAPVPHEYARVQNDFERTRQIQIYLDSALIEAKKGKESVTAKEHTFYNSYITVPARIYKDLISFELKLHEMAQLKKAYEDSGDAEKIQKAQSILTLAKTDLKQLYENRIKGDEIPKWDGWYHPKNRRPNNGFPTEEMLEKIDLNLRTLIQKAA